MVAAGSYCIDGRELGRQGGDDSLGHVETGENESAEPFSGLRQWEGKMSSIDSCGAQAGLQNSPQAEHWRDRQR